MSFADHFSGHAALYAAARPQYPAALFELIAAHAPAHDLAWDCATGNGQAALGLARHFAHVHASDASAAQIERALPDPRVRYAVEPAETTTLASASVDAICIAQALHWFDHARFFAEAQRVLKPGGVIAVTGYDWLLVSPEFDIAFRRHVDPLLAPYWPAQNALLWNGYRDLAFPFERIEAAPPPMAVDWTLGQLLAYVESWSATQRCLADGHAQAMATAAQALQPCWGDPDQPRTVGMRTHLLLGRRAG